MHVSDFSETWLVARHSKSYCIGMSAAELINQVKALPAREREKFLLAVLELERKQDLPKSKGKRIRWPDVEARAKRIFGKRVFPNVVLLEREEQG